MNGKESPPDYSFKILTIGETNVGKTCLILRYTDNSFTRKQITTIGIDFKIKMINFHNKKIKLLIWDTAGQERFRHITNQYYNDADGILLVFDVTNRESFEKVIYWMNQIAEKSEKTKVGVLLIGNKIDDENRIVSKEEAEIFSRNNEIDYIETSALNSYNIGECFDNMLKKILAKKSIDLLNNPEISTGPEKIKLNENEGEVSNCNC